MNKRISLGTVLFLSVFNLSVWGMELNEGDVAKITRQSKRAVKIEGTEKDIEKLIQLLEEVEVRVNEKYDECTVFLGCSGAGKSTLFNYLQRVPLHGTSIGRGRYKIIFDPEIDATEYSSIGKKKTKSETKLPFVRNNNFDCPGFRDPEPLQDIVNAYLIYRVMSQNKKLKVVLVSSVAQLDTGKRQNFLSLLDQIGELYQDNIGVLCNGLCLVITTAEGKDIDKDYYKKFFRDMSKEQLEEGHKQKSSRIKILEFLSNTDRIAFFKMPDKEGPIPGDNRETIDEMLRHVPYQEDIKPKISIPDTSKFQFRKILSFILTKMRTIVSDLSTSYPELYEGFINSHPGEKAGQLRETFRKVTERLQAVSDEPEKFYEGAKNVSETLKLLSHKDREIFGNFVERLIFFANIGFEEEINREIEIFRIFSFLRNFTRGAEGYVADPKINNEGGIARITGGLLGTSDIPEEILRKKDLSEIELYALHSLLIDEDLAVPGVNLTLMAPHWWVINEKTISLKGVEGIAHDDPEARDGIDESSPGEDGLPGKSGGGGGHFYGEGKVFKGLENLAIDVSGGKGGPGQNGGNGARGQEGLPGNLADVQNRREECLIKSTSPNFIKFVLPFMTAGHLGTLDEYESGTLGKNGGDGGKGGAGGLGGMSGKVTLKNKEGSDIQQIHKNERNGDIGDVGIAGDPGEGGEHKPIYTGTYIDIKMFGGYKFLNKMLVDCALEEEEKRKYGLRGQITKILVGYRGCRDLLQHVVKGGAITAEIGYEVFKLGCIYQLGGAYLTTAYPILMAMPLGLDMWYAKPHEKNLEEIRAPAGDRPADLNENGREQPLPKELINSAEKNEHFQRLLQRSRR